MSTETEFDKRLACLDRANLIIRFDDEISVFKVADLIYAYCEGDIGKFNQLNEFIKSDLVIQQKEREERLAQQMEKELHRNLAYQSVQRVKI